MNSLVTLMLAATACSEPPKPVEHADPVAAVEAAPAAPAAAPAPAPAPVEPAGPPKPTEQELKLVADLSRERSDGGPPSEPIVAKRNKVAVADVEAAEKAVDAYREALATTAKANLKRMARGSAADGTYSLEHSKVGFTRVTGTDVGPYTAGMLIMVRACNTDADFSKKLEQAVKDPIAALPPEASGYIARLGYNDEWSCTGWLDQEARYDARTNSVSIR